jgi:DNA-binding response OmpR family regulator
MDCIIVPPDLEIRPADYLALARGRALQLSVRELEVLTEMALQQGRVVLREELYERVWGGTLRQEDRSVDVYMHKLRTKLAAALPEWRYIHTHFGIGYRFWPELAPDGSRGAGGGAAFTTVSQAGNGSVTSSVAGTDSLGA